MVFVVCLIGGCFLGTLYFGKPQYVCSLHHIRCIDRRPILNVCIHFQQIFVNITNRFFSFVFSLSMVGVIFQVRILEVFLKINWKSCSNAQCTSHTVHTIFKFICCFILNNSDFYIVSPKFENDFTYHFCSNQKKISQKPIYLFFKIVLCFQMNIMCQLLLLLISRFVYPFGVHLHHSDSFIRCCIQ